MSCSRFGQWAGFSPKWWKIIINNKNICSGSRISIEDFKLDNQLLEKINKISKSNISVSVTGIAGPSGGTKEKPIGLVYVGIKIDKKINIKKYLFKQKKRAYIQKITVNKSLVLILNSLK